MSTFTPARPAMAKRYSFAELFKKVEHPAHVYGFWVRGEEGCWAISDSVRCALVKAGWVYDVTPETTYFEIIEDRLYAKYQFIIGSRLVCRMKDEA